MSNSALAPGVVLRSPKREYTIRRVLGQGGFGITYLVDSQTGNADSSNTYVFAVKEHFVQMLCAREEGSSNILYLPNSTQEVERSKKAFISEAKRLHKLGIDHPNIVNVDEVFECNRTAYYVMEYLKGGSLAEYIKRTRDRLLWDEVATLMRPICEAVAMLHANRVAHYDIKPQNIMIQQGDDGLRPVLIDFGLAKHYDGQGQATSSIAAAGYTPGYAPLEQYAGLRQFSPTADVYSLAATICFCLTGHTPAKADELNLNALCKELHSFGVDAAVVNVLLQALELRPTDRPADAGVFTAALFGISQVSTIRKGSPTSGGVTTQPMSSSGTPTQEKGDSPTIAKRESTPTQVKNKSGETDNSRMLSNKNLRRSLLITSAIVVLTVVTILVSPLAGGKKDSTQHFVDSTYAEVTEQPAETIPVKEEQPVTLPYRTTPNNLDVQVVCNGIRYYFTQTDWIKLSCNERSCFKKAGIVIIKNGQRFVAKLRSEIKGYNYSEPDDLFSWTEAVEWGRSYFEGGWRLPTKEEGEAMSSQSIAFYPLVQDFGGDVDPIGSYWTSTPCQDNSSNAWGYDLEYGETYEIPKDGRFRLRAVRSL